MAGTCSESDSTKEVSTGEYVTGMIAQSEVHI